MNKNRRKIKSVPVKIKPHIVDSNLLEQQFDILGKLLADRKFDQKKIEFKIPNRIKEEIFLSNTMESKIITPYPDLEVNAPRKQDGVTVTKLFAAKLGEHTTYRGKTENPPVVFESVSLPEPNLTIIGGCTPHALFETWNLAYARHYPLEITPDHIKLAILQGLAIHINESSETLRSRFVDHEGRKKLVVRRDDFGPPGTTTNPWSEFFDQMTTKVRDDLKDTKLVSMIQRSCSTSTPTTKVVYNISVLDAFQKYYSYVCCTLCGIPKIRVRGTVEDWERIKELVDHISQYDLEWWTTKLTPVIDEFISTAKGNVNKKWWRDIVKRHSIGSGGPEYTGWFRFLFPFSSYDSSRGCVNERQNFDKRLYSSDFTSGLSSTPFVWDYYGTEYKMRAVGGFLGMVQTDDGFVSPGISWAVVNGGLKD